MPVGASCLMLVIAVLVANVLKHVLAGLVKLTVSAARPRKDYSLQPSVSILLPCYNEGKTVYDTVESISRSNYPNHKFEIIAIDDYSTDDSYQWLLKSQEDFTNIRIRVSRNPQNQGKARTVCNALKQSEAEIVLSIDSDCIFHPEAIRELVACFVDGPQDRRGGRRRRCAKRQRQHRDRHSDFCLLHELPSDEGAGELDTIGHLHQRLHVRGAARSVSEPRAQGPGPPLAGYRGE
ncbi:MAG: glycosyltransferase family 2 protein [Candidatus Koribacter versatilis]|nr:glycosyltransferase family 2 protein [Candidatus Koribacter versatilis]